MKKRYLYHATYKPVLPLIKQHGLDNTNAHLAWNDSVRGVVYLATDKDIAGSFAETSVDVPDEWVNDIVVLQIDTTFLDLSKLRLDRNIQDNTGYSYEYHGVIPWAAVRKILTYE